MRKWNPKQLGNFIALFVVPHKREIKKDHKQDRIHQQIESTERNQSCVDDKYNAPQPPSVLEHGIEPFHSDHLLHKRMGEINSQRHLACELASVALYTQSSLLPIRTVRTWQPYFCPESERIFVQIGTFGMALAVFRGLHAEEPSRKRCFTLRFCLPYKHAPTGS